MKSSLIIFICLPFNFSYSEEKHDLASTKKDICLEAPQEVYTKKELFEATWYSTTLLKLLSGKTEDAKKQLGQEIIWKILTLNETLEKNQCNVSETTLKKILPFFRLIAAINNNYPIRELKENKEVQKVLNMAIKENPSHYQQMLNINK